MVLPFEQMLRLAIPTRLGSQGRSVIALAFLSMLALTVLEIDLISASMVLLVLTIITCFGNALAHTAGFRNTGIGIGLAIGSGCLVFGIQALIHLGIASTYAHISVLLVMLISISLINRDDSAERSTPLAGIASDSLFAISIALLAFALRHPWALPFAASVFLYERISMRNRYRRWVQPVLLTLLVIGAAIAVALRPERWWYLYLTGDTGYFESIGWSTSEWGAFREHPGGSGGSIAGYHWLSYSFLGTLSHLALLEPFEALTKFGPLLPHVMLASVISRPLGWATHTLKSPACWLISAMVVIGSAFSRFDSKAFGAAICIATLSLLIEHELRPISGWRSSLIFALLIATAIMSKATSALALCALLAIKYLIVIRRDFRFDYRVPIVIIFTGVITYQIFLSGSSYSGLILTIDPNINVHTLTAIITGTPWFGWGMLFVLGVFVHIRRNLNVLPTVLKRFITASSVTAVVFSLTSFINGYADLAMKAAYVFVIAIAAIAAIQMTFGNQGLLALPRITARLALSVTFAFAIGFSHMVLANRSNRGLGLQQRFGDNIWELLLELFPYLILAGWFFVYYIRHHRQQVSSNLMIGLVLVLACAAGVQLDRARRVATWGPNVAVGWTMNDSAMSTDDLREVGSFIRTSTGNDVILATNDFCCFGATWWTDIMRDPVSHRLGTNKWWTSMEDSLWGKDRVAEFGEDFFVNVLPGTLLGGDNYLLAAETRRRVLMQGLKWQTDIPNQDQAIRMSISLEFANSPNAAVAKKLKQFGVSGYVVNLSLTNLRDWSEYAVERFRSGNFVYLELK